MHAFNARASFCARVNTLTFFLATLTAGAPPRLMLPWPENVALAGAPKLAGCGAGAARHESAVTHAGELAALTKHGEDALHACASYTS